MPLKNRPLHLLGLLACLLLAPACARPAPPAATGPERVSVALHSRASTADGRIRLHFASLRDSRCPAGVQCVWAGEAVLSLDLSGPGLAPVALELRWPDHARDDGPGVVAAGHEFRLAALSTDAPVRAEIEIRPLPPAADEDAPMAEHTHHAIDYIEIPATDLAEAKRFYAAAFDWQFNDYGPDYAGIRRPGGLGEAGGLRPAAPGEITRGGPLVILYSDDLDATLARVQAAGGTITTPPFEFPGGRRFHFTDPSGNELAVWAAP